MIAECDGYTFTDYDVGMHPSVDIYRESWMDINCIGVRGDKGQLAQLTRKPCILFDDKERNIDLLRSRSTKECPLDGVVIRTGGKRFCNQNRRRTRTKRMQLAASMPHRQAQKIPLNDWV